MESLHICEKCKKPVLKPVKKDDKFYHQKCINGDTASESPDKEKIFKNFTHQRRMTLNLMNKYSDNYFGKTLMTEVVRPYLQFKYKIKKNKYLELVPQFSLYFEDITEQNAKEFLKNDGLKKFKNELQGLIGNDFTIVIYNALVGSLLTKIFVFIKKINSFGKKGKNKLKNFISKKIKKQK